MVKQKYDRLTEMERMQSIFALVDEIRGKVDGFIGRKLDRMEKAGNVVDYVKVSCINVDSLLLNGGGEGWTQFRDMFRNMFTIQLHSSYHNRLSKCREYLESKNWKLDIQKNFNVLKEVSKGLREKPNNERLVEQAYVMTYGKTKSEIAEVRNIIGTLCRLFTYSIGTIEFFINRNRARK